MTFFIASFVDILLPRAIARRGIALHEYFVVAENTQLLRIPSSVMDRLRIMKVSIPEYAGQTIRVVAVRMRPDASGPPKEVDRMDGFYMKFDSDGYLDEEHQSGSAQLTMSDTFPPLEKTNVINLEKQKERSELREQHQWRITPREAALIARAALKHRGAIKNVRSVKAPFERTAPHSYECNKAYSEIQNQIFKITMPLSHFDEKGLRDLLAMIGDNSKEPASDAPIWDGISEYCRRELAIHERKRTGEGKWYAIVKIMKWDDVNVGEQVYGSEQLCDSREAAVAEAKRLAAEMLKLRSSLAVRFGMTAKAPVWRRLMIMLPAPFPSR